MLDDAGLGIDFLALELFLLLYTLKLRINIIHLYVVTNPFGWSDIEGGCNGNLRRPESLAQLLEGRAGQRSDRKAALRE